jgi:hypothetical protein
MHPHSWQIRHVFQEAVSEGQNYGLCLYYIYSHMIKTAPEYETITHLHNRSCNIQHLQEQVQNIVNFWISGYT